MAKEAPKPDGQLFYDAFKASKIGIALEDFEGRPLFVNPALCSMLGFSEEEMRSKHCVEFSPPDDAKKDWALFEQLRAGVIDHYQIEKRYFRRDGSLMWGRLNISLLNHGTSPLVIAQVEDITDKKTVQETLELATKQIAAVTRCSRDFRYLWANQQCADLLQRPLDEIVGRPISEVLGEEAFASQFHHFERVLSGEKVVYEEEVNYQSVGRIWIAATYTPTLNAGGAVDGWVAVILDVTERKQAELVLRESEERFRLVANTAPVMIWMSGPDGEISYLNQCWLDFTGRSEPDLLTDLAQVVHPEDYGQGQKIYEDAFAERRPFRKECRLRRHDGQYRWITDVGVPRYDEAGHFSGYIGTSVDVTDHKEVEESLSHLSRRLIEAQEEERRWIARELHDDISQRIASLMLSLTGLNVQSVKPEVQTGIAQAIQDTSDLDKELRALSRRLHSSNLEYVGLMAAASAYCRERSIQHKIEVGFHSEGIPRDLPQDVSLCLFRVLQEALQNAIKHSGSRHFQVALKGTPGEIELTVRDFGAGFELDDASKGRGLGLTSMRERLKLVNGKFVINSQPGAGTSIHARVPRFRQSSNFKQAGT
jgi:PAS domain S-box-containing protein